MGLPRYPAEPDEARGVGAPRDVPLARPEAGHGRGKADRTDRNLRGVPVIGHGSGAISQTSPGSDAHLDAIMRTVVVRKGAASLVIEERIKAARITLRFGPDESA